MATFNLEDTCTRCGKSIVVKKTSAAEADAYAGLSAKRAANAKLIEEFIAAIPTDELPDTFGFYKGKDEGSDKLEVFTVSQTVLCSAEPVEGSKTRSCTHRTTTAVQELTTLPPRAPRTTKKAESAETPAAEATPAATDAATASPVDAPAAGETPTS